MTEYELVRESFGSNETIEIPDGAIDVSARSDLAVGPDYADFDGDVVVEVEYLAPVEDQEMEPSDDEQMDYDGEIWIYGAYDDQIEVSGDLDEEFITDDGEPTELNVRVSTLRNNSIAVHDISIDIEYDREGIWRIGHNVGLEMENVDLVDYGFGVNTHPYTDHSDALRIRYNGSIKVWKDG